MPKASKRLKDIISKNRASLGLDTIFSNRPSSSREGLSTSSSSENLLSLFDNLSLETLPITNNLDITNSSENIMEGLRFHTSLLPSFSGVQTHLESFLISIDEFHSLYHNNDADQQKIVLAAIKSKLTDDAREFLLSRPDLKTWPTIKEALRQKFGDPINYQILIQQLQYFKINKSENILQFVDRLKTFVHRIFAKIQCEVADQNAKLILISQVEQTSVLILTANSPQTLKTMLMLQRPNKLDDAYSQVLNYNMIESQVNFTNNTTLFNTSFNTNPTLQAQSTTKFLHPHIPPMAFPQQQKFPSQPIQMQSRPTQRHYPTNSQVFGNQKTVFAPQNINKPRAQQPTPMSISTGGPSRITQQKQSFFKPSGARNFISEELTNVETYTDPTNVEFYPAEQSHDSDYSQTDFPSEEYTYSQNFENVPINQDLSSGYESEQFTPNTTENFTITASNPKLT